MGYEVVHADDARRAPDAGRDRAPVAAHTAQPGRVRLVRAARSTRWPASWPRPSWLSRPSRPSRLSRLSRPSWLPGQARTRLAVLAIGALAAGSVAGGSWTAHVQEQQARAALASTLSATALVEDVDSVGGEEPYADITVRVVNAGPLPLTVIASPRGAHPTATAPVVRDLGGAMSVAAGDTLAVSLRVAVDCSGRDQPPRRVWVPVRTADGSAHRLMTRARALDAFLPFGRAPCSGPSGQRLLAQLTGSISRPVLRLTNESRRALTVTLDVERSPFVAQSTNFSVLRLSPSLPLVLAPQSSKDLVVLLTPWSCPGDLAVALSPQRWPYFVLRVGPAASDVLSQELVNVDLSALWGAALSRECP